MRTVNNVLGIWDVDGASWRRSVFKEMDLDH